MQTDPVCGMAVDENTTVAQSAYKDKTYFFCAFSAL
jgi:YHS domain-containing protein